MGWIIERDDKGYPARMWFTDDADDTRDSCGNVQPEPLHFMPAVRDWARARGIDPAHGLPDPEPCA